MNIRPVLLSALLVLTLGGCATVARPNPDDPLESWNRSVFQFNEAVDRVVLKPVATGYQNVVPSLVRTGVGNFFDNLRDAWSFVNNVLQAKPTGAADSALRFGVNTIMGVGGLFDVAGEMNIPRHREDFGQTLGYWGVRPGPYLVLPLLGPSTMRDTAALAADYFGDPVLYVNPFGLRLGLLGIRIVDTRADLLRTTSLLSDVALDKYSFVRDAYLQFRRAAIGREGEKIGQDRLRDGRSWVNDLTNRSGPARSGTSDDDAAGMTPDYTQPDSEPGKTPDYTQPADDAGRAPDYTQPADDAGKAPDYTQP